MRSTTVLALITMLVLPSAVSAQAAKGASPEAIRANRHYERGWSAMRAESWAEAASEFQQAIDIDPKFALAYYSLGRADMGLHDFTKAIAAYTRCRDLYVSSGGELYTDQLAATRRLEDRILQLRTALNQANQSTGIKSQAQSQGLYTRQLQTQLDRLEQARQRDLNISIDTSVPYFVSMAIGTAYFRSARFADAEREYEAAIEENPSSGETHSNLAVLYLETGRIDEAERAVKAAEKTGFKVNPMLKNDIAAAKTKGR